MVSKPGSYGGKDIQVLEGLEPVRKRPGMYIGSTGPRGLHHLVYEVVDNSVDEALAGFCENIEVWIHEDNSVTVADDGRGIPVDKHPTEKIPTVEVVLTVLHAGGKFGGDGYKVSGGLHGVGVSVVNALSKRVEVCVCRDGSEYQIAFEYGETVQKLKKIGSADRTGTKVTFWPDPEIFTETTVFDYDTLATRFREMAFLNKGLKITLHDERSEAARKGSVNTIDAEGGAAVATAAKKTAVQEGGEGGEPEEVRTDSFCYKGGIVDFVAWLTEGKETLNRPIYFEAENQDGTVEVCMQWTSSYSSNSVLAFANNINTHEGGTHMDGFKQAVTRTINEYARSKNILKGKDSNLTGDDCREGLAAIVSVKLHDPQFEGQTKTKLGNTEIRGLVQTAVTRGLAEYLEENPTPAKRIVGKAALSRNVHSASYGCKKVRVIRSNGLLGRKIEAAHKGLPELRKEMQRTAEECNIASDRLAAGKT